MATRKPPFDITLLWEQLSTAPQPELLSSKSLEKLRESSHNPLQRLRRAIRINSGYTLLFGVLWLALLLYIPDFWLRFLIGILLGAHVIGLAYNRYLLRNVLANPPADMHIHSRLKHIHLRMQQALRGIEYVALFFYPISATIGFAYALLEADKLHLLNEKFEVQLTLIVSLLVLVPICFLITRLLHKQAYGKQLTKLQELINEFEKNEVVPT
ncbi:MAG: hypothetical protein ACK417_03115 [Bacteroidia bacterium]